MFYLRHVVLQDVLASRNPYDLLLYIREDNRFLVPFKEVVGSAMADVHPGALPWVVVDENRLCGFDAYSDKIYLTDLPGARLLFARNETEYLDFIKLWASGTLMKHQLEHGENGRIKKFNLKSYPLQTEAFYLEYMNLHGFEVHQRNFFRTDFRYESENGINQGCRPYIYVCCVDFKLVLKTKLKTCPHRKQMKQNDKCLEQIGALICKPWCTKETCNKTKCKGCMICPT